MHPEIEAELARCAKDFWYFCTTYLKIRTTDNKIIPLIPNRAQRLVLRTILRNRKTYVLKSRQMGITTIMWAWRFWKWLFFPVYEGLTTAHREEDAINIFKIPRRFYDLLPEWMKKRFPRKQENTQAMVLIDGERTLKAKTVGGGGEEEQSRGGTLSDLHCTEFAFYRNFDTTMAGLFQQVGKNPIVLETTANGMNEAYNMWGADNGYYKLFLPWTLDDRYVQQERPALYKPTWEHYAAWEEYATKWYLTDEQLHWGVETFCTLCNLNWDIFNQEYPMTAEVAFITSGKQFFNKQYPHVESFDGAWRWHKFEVGRRYSAGIDVSSGGSDGDYQAVSILDVTDFDKPFKVASLYCKVDVSIFAEWALDLVNEYPGTLVTIERNPSGQAVIEHFIDNAYPYMYREMRKDRITGKPKEEFGRATTGSNRLTTYSGLQYIINMGIYDPVDPRTQKEINTFVYGDDGQPSAAGKRAGSSKRKAGVKGLCYDDMITSEGLAWVGREQARALKVPPAQMQKPTNIREKLEWEMKYGVSFNKDGHRFFGGQQGGRGENPSSMLRRRVQRRY
jgi:hypothetical protein